MKILDIKDNQVIVNPEVIEIPEFKVLWDRDKSRGKETFFKEVKYIYYMESIASPFADYPDKEKLIISDIFKTNYKPDNFIQEAVIKFRVLSETPLQNLFKAVKEKINELASFLRETQVSEETLTSILKTIESTAKFVEKLDILKNSIDKEIEDSNQKVRGDKKVGRNED